MAKRKAAHAGAIERVRRRKASAARASAKRPTAESAGKS